MERDEAVQLVKRYDAERPSEKTKKMFLSYVGFSPEQLEAVMERWRNTRLWRGAGPDSELINQISS